MRILLYLSRTKIKDYYPQITGNPVLTETKTARGIHGAGELKVGVMGGELKGEKRTEEISSTFWPQYLDEMLASDEFRQAILLLPDSVEKLNAGSWCKCVCHFSVVEYREASKQVKVEGELIGKGRSAIQIHLSCGYQHFSVSDAEDQISSYAAPFVHDKETVKLEVVFLVSSAKLVEGIHVVSGSPLYMRIPERRLPWQE